MSTCDSLNLTFQRLRRQSIRRMACLQWIKSKLPLPEQGNLFHGQRPEIHLSNKSQEGNSRSCRRVLISASRASSCPTQSWLEADKERHNDFAGTDQPGLHLSCRITNRPASQSGGTSATSCSWAHAGLAMNCCRSLCWRAWDVLNWRSSPE